jgi:hypothetical protein
MQDECRTNSCSVTVRDVCKYQNKYQSILKTVTYVTRAANEAESGLWAEREALGHLAAERDVRQDTIDRLRSAEEMAVPAVRRLPKEC